MWHPHNWETAWGTPVKRTLPPCLLLMHPITMLLIALYIMLGISLTGIVILSTLPYCMRMHARISHNIEILIMHLANLILDHTRTPVQLSHDLEISMTCRSSLMHLSSLTEITKDEFNCLWLSRMRSWRLQNICLLQLFLALNYHDISFTHCSDPR